MKNKNNRELRMRRDTKTRHHQTCSLRHQKKAAHKENRVQARTYLQAVERFGIYTEVLHG